MKNNIQKITEDILKNLGEKENIKNIANCMTRLRVTVNNKDLVNIEELKKIEGVLGVIHKDQDTYIQIVLGPGKAAKSASVLSSLTNLTSKEVDENSDSSDLKEKNKNKNNTPFKQALKKVAAIFVPIIPAFIACGLVVAIYECTITLAPEFQHTDIGKIVNVIAYSVFQILPIIVGYNASKEFGGTPVIGAVLAAILNHPSLDGIHIFSHPIQVGCGGIISIIFIALGAAFIEKQLRKIIPDSLDLFLTPFLTIASMTFVGIFVLDPICNYISSGIGIGVEFIIYRVPALAGILSAIYLPLVITGMHHSLIAINTHLLEDIGITYLLPITCMAGASQVGASIAVFVRTKNKRLKKTIKSALPVGFLGIGEPLLWGVTIPLGRPFIASCLGGAVGGSIMALLKVGSKVPELSGIPLGFVTNNMIGYFIALVASYVAGFIICFAMGFKDPQD